MNFLGQSQTGSIDPADQEKLDSIEIEPTGEVKFDNGIIVNGNSSEINTIQTYVDDDFLELKTRDPSNLFVGVTTKDNTGLYSSIYKGSTGWVFTDGGNTEANFPKANLDCKSVQGIDVATFKTTMDTHTSNGSIHRTQNDNTTSSTTLWSSQKTADEIAASAGSSGQDLQTHIDDQTVHFEIKDGTILNPIPTTDTHVWSSLKTESEIGKVEQVLGDHVLNQDIHQQIDDNQIATDSLWSSNKINTNIVFAQSVLQSNIDNHVNNLDLHRVIDDKQITTDSL